MRTIALVTQKGGSGKSTLSASLAVASQANRELVFLLDLDPQKSLTTWAQNRNDENLAVQAITPGQLPSVLNTLSKGHVSLAIIDTPAGVSDASEAAIQAARPRRDPGSSDGLRHLGQRGDMAAGQGTPEGIRLHSQSMPDRAGQPPHPRGHQCARSHGAASFSRWSPPGSITRRRSCAASVRPSSTRPVPRPRKCGQLWASLRRRIARAKLNQQAGRRAA